MKILNRTQVTKVVTNRTVCHTIEHNNSIFVRVAEISTTLPYMDNKPTIVKESVCWDMYVASKVTQPLTKKEATILKLEELFQSQPIEHLNGHMVDYFKERNK